MHHVFNRLARRRHLQVPGDFGTPVFTQQTPVESVNSLFRT